MNIENELLACREWMHFQIMMALMHGTLNRKTELQIRRKARYDRMMIRRNAK